MPNPFRSPKNPTKGILYKLKNIQLTGNVTGNKSLTSLKGTCGVDSGTIRHDQLVLNSATNDNHDSRYLNLTGLFGDQQMIQWDLAYSGTPAEGAMYWNDDDKTLNLGLANGSVLQLGQEVVIRAQNGEAVQIDNGEVVYISGATGPHPIVKLANAAEENAAVTIAIATQDVAASQYGYFATFGLVRGLNTSVIGAAGAEVFLDDTDGGITTDKIDHPNFRIRLGYIVRSHATEGSIFVAIEPDQWLKRFQAMQEPTGFDENQPQLNGDISFVNGTRTFTIQPQGGETYFNYWYNGREWRKTTESLVIADTEGEHYIYYNSAGTLTESVNPSRAALESIYRDEALVAYIRWDATNNEAVWFNNERHLNRMDGNHHAYHHFSDGTKWIAGGALGDFDVGETTADSGAQFSYSAGTIADEDILSNESNIASTIGNEIIYRLGANGDWRRITETGFSCLTDTTAGIGSPTGRLVWNEFTGGAWQLTTVADNKFVLYHIIQTLGNATGERVFSIVGQNEYATLSAARDGALTERNSLILNGLAGPEFAFLGTVLYQTKSSYANSVKATIRETIAGAETYVDWRATLASPGSGTSSHSNLTELFLAASGVTYGHVDDQSQTIAGAKTFSSELTTDSHLEIEDGTSSSAVASTDHYRFEVNAGRLQGIHDTAGVPADDLSVQEQETFHGNALALSPESGQLWQESTHSGADGPQTITATSVFTHTVSTHQTTAMHGLWSWAGLYLEENLQSDLSAGFDLKNFSNCNKIKVTIKHKVGATTGDFASAALYCCHSASGETPQSSALTLSTSWIIEEHTFDITAWDFSGAGESPIIGFEFLGKTLTSPPEVSDNQVYLAWITVEGYAI